MNQSIHRHVLTRLFLVWLFLTPLAGGVVAYLEFEQVDEQVLDLVLREAANIDQALIDALPEGTEEVAAAFQRRANALVERSFVLVDIYDERQDHLASAVRYGNAIVQATLDARHHQFPLDERFHYEKFEVGDDWYVQVLLPLFSSGKELVGYFEGVYKVDPEALEYIENQVYRALLFVIIIVSATTVALYPIILYLNRQLIRFSSEIFRANIDLMRVMGASIAKRDHTTDAHNYRVTLYAIKMGELLGFDDEQMRHLITGAFLHDVGKIGVPDAILCKEGELTEEERRLMQEHVRIGLDIVRNAEWLKGASDVIRYHHERYDGSGYLEGLAGEAIPINARIFAIIDVFDALMSRRPYKEPYELKKALAVLERGRGGHFDPQLLDLFIEHAPGWYRLIGRASYEDLSHKLSLETRNYFFDAPVGSSLSPRSPHSS